MYAKEQLFSILKDLTTRPDPIYLSVDCSDGQSLIVSIRQGDQSWQAIDPVEVNMNRLCDWFMGRGFDIRSQPVMVGGYQYSLFCHVDDPASRAINAQRLRDAASSHDQSTIKVPAHQDLFALLESADPACNQVTLLIQINYASRSYTLAKIRYYGQFMTDLPSPIRLTESMFNATLRSAGWSMVGAPSHQKGMNRISGQLVSNEYHYILQRGSAGVNQLNKATDLQEWKGQKERLERVGSAFASGKLNGIPEQAQRSIVNNPAKLDELEAIRDL